MYNKRTQMAKAKVSIVRASEYDYAELSTAVKHSIELIGGLRGLINPGSRVFVKINHLSPASPAERGIVTHPIFVEAVLKLLKSSGAGIIVGDDIDYDSRDGFLVSGLREACHRAGVTLINLKEAGFVEIDCHGKLLEKVYVSKVALDADVIVNLPKFKTHSLTIFTGGVKNMYGVIPHGLRIRFHGEYPGAESFSQVLTDIFAVVKPQLTVMDGVNAMESEGPASGSLVKLEAILASYDAVALDAVAATIIGLAPMDIYTTRYASERGLGIGSFPHIEVLGERLEDIVVTGFRLPAGATSALTRRAPRALSRRLLEQTSMRPRVVKSHCTACRECERVCPVSAISVSGKTAKIDYRVCLHCLCCHEVCHFDAIRLWRPVSGHLLDCLVKTWQRLMGAVR
jgi:uncharacterized protein (DUF362 family)/Pyruvate/2-oxoacid:ferredoxin oxidoreductase delta subunit